MDMTAWKKPMTFRWWLNLLKFKYNRSAMKQLRDLLLGEGQLSPQESMNLLKKQIISPSIKRMNADSLPVQFALYGDQYVPKNQTNLGDVRTRMGSLLEFEIAKAMQECIRELSIEDVFVTYIVANKYPDLAIRSGSGKLGIRFEVKTVQTIAEERAANFDTLIKDVRQDRDYVFLMVWDWIESSVSSEMKTPFIKLWYLFDAYALAQMRDTYWLNNPPGDLGGGRQGYDLCFGVNCKKGKYNEEEGNYGKISRMNFSSVEAYLPERVKDTGTHTAYEEFRIKSLEVGFRDIVLQHMKNGVTNVEITSPNLPFAAVVNYDKGNVLVCGQASLSSPKKLKEEWRTVVSDKKCGYFIQLNTKYNWRIYDSNFAEVIRGDKPILLEEWLDENLSG